MASNAAKQLTVAHLGDLHLKEGARFLDTIACIEHAIKKAKEASADLFAIPGDLFDGKSTIAERNTLLCLVLKMADSAPVVILYGNHDKPGDLDFLGCLGGVHKIHVVSRPTILQVAGAALYCFPHLDKAAATGAMDSEVSASMVDTAIVQMVRTYLQTWREHAANRPNNQQALFLCHGSLEGSMASNGETMIGHGLSFNLSDIDIGADAYLFNHIHVRQFMNSAQTVGYAGSIARGSFGEEKDEKGFLLWTVDGDETQAEFIKTPARRMLTFEANYLENVAFPWSWSPSLEDPESINGAEVRIRLSFPSDRRADAELLAQQCEDDFASLAYSVKIEMRARAVARIRSESIVSADTAEESLVSYWEATETPTEEVREERIRKARQLEAEAKLTA